MAPRRNGANDARDWVAQFRAGLDDFRAHGAEQLERAVAEVMKKLQAGAKYPKKPAGPVKVEKK